MRSLSKTGYGSWPSSTTTGATTGDAGRAGGGGVAETGWVSPGVGGEEAPAAGGMGVVGEPDVGPPGVVVGIWGVGDGTVVGIGIFFSEHVRALCPGRLQRPHT